MNITSISDIKGVVYMVKINGFRIGYMCPMCAYIIPEQNIKSHSIKWLSKNEGMSEIQCPTCNSVSLLKEWKMVKYPCVPN